MKALFAMQSHLPPLFFTARALGELRELVELDTQRTFTALDSVGAEERAEVDVLITAWGAPRLDARALESFPRLQAIVHAAGTVRFIDEEAWRRGILVSTAAAANAVPVAEFAVAMITLAGKDVFWVAREYAREQRFIDREIELPQIGNFGRTVGIVGASKIGSLVLDMLRRYDFEVLVYDPFCSPQRARALGAELVGDLEELAGRSSILGIHAPSRPETRHLVSARVIAALPDNATIINTARPDIVDQTAMLSELTSGRIRAILDVTSPEVPSRGHEFYTLPNVFVTPHLAGAAGNELHRLGNSALGEVRRLVAGEPLAHLVQQHELAHMA